MKRFLQCGVVAGAVALGVVVGHRLSAEAMAVVVGVVCGVVASIPTSVMILIVTRRLGAPSRPHQLTSVAQGTAYPPVVVIQADARGGGSQFAPPVWDVPPAVENQPWQRSFSVVGSEGGS